MFISLFKISIFNPKIYYQFLVSVDYALFGKYMETCSIDTVDASYDSYSYNYNSNDDEFSRWTTNLKSSSSNNLSNMKSTSENSDTTTCDVDEIYYAYYYVSVVLFLTLGRPNSISFLWHTTGEIRDILDEMHAKYVAMLEKVTIVRTDSNINDRGTGGGDSGDHNIDHGDNIDIDDVRRESTSVAQAATDLEATAGHGGGIRSATISTVKSIGGSKFSLAIDLDENNENNYNGGGYGSNGNSLEAFYKPQYDDKTVTTTTSQLTS